MATVTERTLWNQNEEEGYWQAILQQGCIAPPPSIDSQPPGDWHTTTAPSWRWGDSNRAAGESNEGIPPADWEEEWEELRHYYDTGNTLQLTVEHYNRGGLLVRHKNIRGFVPASQLIDLEQNIDSRGREAYLREREGDVLTLKVIELDPDSNHAVFSERAAQWEGQCPDRILQDIKPGDICKGRVSNLCVFGAFVDLGGVDGLIHVSELSWQHVTHPRDLLQPGQEVEVYVVEVDRERRRVALSLKRLRPDPWSRAEDRYQVGQLVTGVVTNVVDFGAFVQVEDGLEGLVHISELAEGNFLHPRNVVQENDVITARIMHIDSVAHRLGLSLRQAHDNGSSWVESPVGNVLATTP